jgi:hypothetical protein
MASAVVVDALGAVVYNSANMRTSSLLRHSKQLPRAAITASTNLAATPSLIAAATSSEVTKPAPFDASLAAVEVVLHLGELGLIN